MLILGKVIWLTRPFVSKQNLAFLPVLFLIEKVMKKVTRPHKGQWIKMVVVLLLLHASPKFFKKYIFDRIHNFEIKIAERKRERFKPPSTIPSHPRVIPGLPRGLHWQWYQNRNGWSVRLNVKNQLYISLGRGWNYKTMGEKW